MPEGDTVWLAARRLHDALAGETLTRSDFRVPQLATADLAGRVVTEVVSRGKHILTRVGGERPVTLRTHFRMDGSWHLYRSGERWRGGPAWQVRLVLETTRWQAVGYRLPVVDLVATEDEPALVGHLGPDLLGPDWDLEEALRRIRSQPTRPIGEALLDQRNLAGIGALYRAETLFLRGVHPREPVAQVDQGGGLAAVVLLAQRLMRANLQHPAQVTTGDSRRGHQHWVFERAGQPCRRCGTRIGTEEFGPPAQPRRSYWCPTCQPLRS